MNVLKCSQSVILLASRSTMSLRGPRSFER
jgi:hypothetical protein